MKIIYCMAEVHPTHLEMIGDSLIKLGLINFSQQYRTLLKNLNSGMLSVRKCLRSIERMVKHVDEIIAGTDAICRAWEIEEREISLLDRIARKPCVYLEGIPGVRPMLESHIYSMEGRVIYLDKEFSPYVESLVYLKKGDETLLRKVKETKKGREEHWRKIIQENPPKSFETPVTIVGEDHFRNSVDSSFRKIVNRVTNRYVGNFGEKLKELGYLPIIFKVYEEGLYVL